MIAHDGLVSVLCETRPARILAAIAVLLNALALHFFFTEVARNPMLKLSGRQINFAFGPLLVVLLSFLSAVTRSSFSTKRHGCNGECPCSTQSIMVLRCFGESADR